MMLLELTLNFLKPSCNYRRVVSNWQYYNATKGVKPLSLEKVKDSQMKEFIERCIAKVSKRCSARDLLKDPFIKIDMVDEAEGHSAHSCSSGKCANDCICK